MARKNYNIRKGRRRPSGDRINYSALLDAINHHRQVRRPSGSITKQGDTN